MALQIFTATPLYIIDKLIDFDFEENATKINRFANYLRVVLPGIDPQITLLATKALGHLAASGASLSAEFVQFEVKRALEWLQGDRQEARRFAGVLLIKEMALAAPTIVFTYITQIFDLIWNTTRDTKVNIREGAADALSACLELINQRSQGESSSRKQWHRRIFEEVNKGFKMNSSDSVHGSLLTLKEVLTHIDPTVKKNCDRRISE